MGKTLRIVMLVLVLLTVAMISAITAMRFAIHGREVRVPKLTGLTELKAEQSARDAGVVLTVENSYYSATIPEGAILTQLPAEGTQVRRGWRVRVAQSLGPQRAEIPNLIGQSLRAAEINIQRRGLELAEVATARIPGALAGEIIGQSPPPYSSGLTEPRVRVLTAAPDSAPGYVMPNFIGKHFADAAPVVEQAGFRVAPLVEVPQPAGPEVASSQTATVSMPNAPTAIAPTANTPISSPGALLIVKQHPAPGEKIIAGATVTFEVLR